MQTTGLMVVLAITVALMVGIAYDGPIPSERPESNVRSAAPALSPTKLLLPRRFLSPVPPQPLLEPPLRPSAPQQLLLPPWFLGPVPPHRQLTALPRFWS